MIRTLLHTAYARQLKLLVGVFMVLFLLLTPLQTTSVNQVLFASADSHITQSTEIDIGTVGNALYGAFLSVINALLAAIVSVVGSILAIVGFGFDYVLDKTIVNFGTFYNDNFKDGLTIAWTGFRDVANIVMIAMFVFVAFAVMLRISSYGLKEFGVRILVVAVLINFSLFFTKVIIDVSNITATQFGKAIVVTNADTGTTGSVSQAIAQRAGFFGIDYSNSYQAIQDASNKQNDKSFGTALLYTMLSVVFGVALIAVLLYGLILLATRAVLFLLLMATSALAFAAYLVPKYGNTWWDKWWSALLTNAFFAPLFMLLLWATLNIIKTLPGASTDPADSLIKGLATNSSSTWEPIFSMMVVIGLVYASTKIASELSVAGEGFARKISKGGASFALRASGTRPILVGLANLGLRARNATARGAANVAANSRLPGTVGLATSLNALSNIKHVGDTQAGKALKKNGVDLGSDQSEAIGKYLAERELNRAKGNQQKNLNQEKASLPKKEGEVNEEAEKNEKQRLAAVESASREREAKEQPHKDNQEAKEAELKSEFGARDTLERNIKVNERKLLNPDLDSGERSQLEREANTAQTQINQHDRRIEDLRKEITNAQQAREAINEEHQTTLNDIADSFKQKKEHTSEKLQALKKRFEELGDDDKIEAEASERAKPDARKAIENRGFWSGASKSVKERALSEIKKSKDDKRQEALVEALGKNKPSDGGGEKKKDAA